MGKRCARSEPQPSVAGTRHARGSGMMLDPVLIYAVMTGALIVALLIAYVLLRIRESAINSYEAYQALVDQARIKGVTDPPNFNPFRFLLRVYPKRMRTWLEKQEAESLQPARLARSRLA